MIYFHDFLNSLLNSVERYPLTVILALVDFSSSFCFFFGGREAIMDLMNLKKNCKKTWINDE